MLLLLLLVQFSQGVQQGGRLSNTQLSLFKQQHGIYKARHKGMESRVGTVLYLLLLLLLLIVIATRMTRCYCV